MHLLYCLCSHDSTCSPQTHFYRYIHQISMQLRVCLHHINVDCHLEFKRCQIFSEMKTFHSLNMYADVGRL